MNCTRAEGKFCKHPYDEVVWGFIFADLLPTGVTIASVDDVDIEVEQGTDVTTLVVAGATVNAAAFDDDDGEEVAIGKAVRATVSGGTDAVWYLIQIKVTLSSGEKFGGAFLVHVEDS